VRTAFHAVVGAAANFRLFPERRDMYHNINLLEVLLSSSGACAVLRVAPDGDSHTHTYDVSHDMRRDLNVHGATLLSDSDPDLSVILLASDATVDQIVRAITHLASAFVRAQLRSGGMQKGEDLSLWPTHPFPPPAVSASVYLAVIGDGPLDRIFAGSDVYRHDPTFMWHTDAALECQVSSCFLTCLAHWIPLHKDALYRAALRSTTTYASIHSRVLAQDLAVSTHVEQEATRRRSTQN
jgi:hypothetical protein